MLKTTLETHRPISCFVRRATKIHQCQECHQHIFPKQKYYFESGRKKEDSFYNYKRCYKCHEITLDTKKIDGFKFEKGLLFETLNNLSIEDFEKLKLVKADYCLLSDRLTSSCYYPNRII